MPDIKIFVCGHESFSVPRHSILYPLQVGAALADEHFAGCLYDDVGENISTKNRYYCELTGQYWAWRNIEADYYGFFHYRRYLYPNLQARRPYIVRRTLDLERLGYDGFGELIRQYDMILPMEEDMHMKVRAHYAQAHRREDLALAETILGERHPEMADALEDYLGGTKQVFGNIFIMQRDVFMDYCAWLFPLLTVFDEQAVTLAPRTDGYIAERLLGIYATHRRRELRALELPRVHFYSDEEYTQRRILNAVLPPGSKRRAVVKEMVIRGR